LNETLLLPETFIFPRDECQFFCWPLQFKNILQPGACQTFIVSAPIAGSGRILGVGGVFVRSHMFLVTLAERIRMKFGM
jgi:hypothetical protein